MTADYAPPTIRLSAELAAAGGRPSVVGGHLTGVDRVLVRAAIPPAEMRPLESVRQWIYSRIGLHYPERKQLLLYQRLQKLCWQLEIPSLKELDRHLKQRDFPGLPMEVACAVSTNHTYFFREEKVMRFFREQILSRLPEKVKWRIWSAAAASGEEAYTVAIILAEALGLVQALDKAIILGTDVDHTAIEQAERGIYHEQRLEMAPPFLRRQYFQPAGSRQWRIASGLQRMCIFRRFNLMSAPWPFSKPFHVIFCRNVLYYFDQEHQRELVERLYDATVPGGWLITSVTESLSDMKTRWQAVTPGVYRKA